MNTAAGAARSEDISSLKEPILTYAAVHSPTGEIQLQIKSSSSKADTRGWNHPLTARLMCPIQYLEQFDDDPKQYVLLTLALIQIAYLTLPWTRMMQDLQEGRISFTADEFPAFMYAVDSYDPNDMEKGLLCHEFPLAVSLGFNLISMGSSYCCRLADIFSRHHQLLYELQEHDRRQSLAKPRCTVSRP
jgi:hypothetical protein